MPDQVRHDGTISRRLAIRRFYICGPDDFVGQIKTTLKEFGARPDLENLCRIQRFDEFFNRPDADIVKGVLTVSKLSLRRHSGRLLAGIHLIQPVLDAGSCPA
jgi:ferredoxin-NADP reductase